MTKHISSHSVKLGRGLAMYVRCLDASGAPICAARVVFKWPTKNGTTSVVRYTASDGRIADYHYVSGLRAGRTAKVRAINTSSGKSKTATISFKPHH